VLIGVLAITAHTASSYTLSILMKPMLVELGWDRTTFASAMTLRMFLLVLALSWAGKLTDRYGTRMVLFCGALTVGSGVLGIASAQTQSAFFGMMAVMGPGQAFIGPVAASALVLRVTQHRRGIAVGVLNGADNLISSSIPIAAAWLLAHGGWRSTLTSLGLAYFALALLIVAVLPQRAGSASANQTAGAPPARARLRDLPWSDWRLWAIGAIYAGIYAFVTSVQLHLHAYQTDLGRTPTQASQTMSLLILAGAFGAPLFGWVSERIGARTALLLMVGGLAGSSTLLSTLEVHSAFLAWGLAYGLVNSGVVALLALVLAEIYGAEQIGRLMGVSMVFCMAATMLANLYSAAMFDAYGSYVRVWQSYTALMILTLVPAIALQRASRKDRRGRSQGDPPPFPKG